MIDVLLWTWSGGMDVKCWPLLVAFYDMQELPYPATIADDKYNKQGLQWSYYNSSNHIRSVTTKLASFCRIFFKPLLKLVRTLICCDINSHVRNPSIQKMWLGFNQVCHNNYYNQYWLPTDHLNIFKKNLWIHYKKEC